MMGLDQRQTIILNSLKKIEYYELAGFELDKLLFNNSKFAIESSWIKTIKDSVKRVIYNSFKIDFVDANSELLLVSYDYKRTDH